MKKFVSKVLVVLMLALTLTGITSAAYAKSVNTVAPAVFMRAEITPFAEEVEWIIQYNKAKGVYQTRLWSYTRGIWLTDWIDMV